MSRTARSPRTHRPRSPPRDRGSSRRCRPSGWSRSPGCRHPARTAAQLVADRGEDLGPRGPGDLRASTLMTNGIHSCVDSPMAVQPAAPTRAPIRNSRSRSGAGPTAARGRSRRPERRRWSGSRGRPAQGRAEIGDEEVVSCGTATEVATPTSAGRGARTGRSGRAGPGRTAGGWTAYRWAWVQQTWSCLARARREGRPAVVAAPVARARRLAQPGSLKRFTTPAGNDAAPTRPSRQELRPRGAGRRPWPSTGRRPARPGPAPRPRRPPAAGRPGAPVRGELSSRRDRRARRVVGVDALASGLRDERARAAPRAGRRPR